MYISAGYLPENILTPSLVSSYGIHLERDPHLTYFSHN